MHCFCFKKIKQQNGKQTCLCIYSLECNLDVPKIQETKKGKKLDVPKSYETKGETNLHMYILSLKYKVANPKSQETK